MKSILVGGTFNTYKFDNFNQQLIFESKLLGAFHLKTILLTNDKN